MKNYVFPLLNCRKIVFLLFYFFYLTYCFVCCVPESEGAVYNVSDQQRSTVNNKIPSILDNFHVDSRLSRLELKQEELKTKLTQLELNLSLKLDQIIGDTGKIFLLQQILRQDFKESLKQTVVNNRDESTVDSTRDDRLLSLQSNQTLNQIYQFIESNLTKIQNQTVRILDEIKSTVTAQQFGRSMRDINEKLSVIDGNYRNCYGKTLAISDKSRTFPKNCAEINETVANSSTDASNRSIQLIWPDYMPRAIFVSCDFLSDAEGWTVIQSRYDGTVNFVRDWIDYKHGFGNVAGEYWIGLESIFQLTNQQLCQLQVELEDFEGERVYARYATFAIGSEVENYQLKLLGQYSGDAGDALAYHSSMQFSTPDRDNDRWPAGNCAGEHMGGWWYNQCESANLNGLYLAGLSSQQYKGIYWSEWQGPGYSLKSVRMMVRPAN